MMEEEDMYEEGVELGDLHFDADGSSLLENGRPTLSQRVIDLGQRPTADGKILRHRTVRRVLAGGIATMLLIIIVIILVVNIHGEITDSEAECAPNCANVTIITNGTM
jgi:hypothetical protein